jgi:hypothetical protein
MVVSNNIIYGSLARRINILCLLAAIILVLVLPFKKEIWYDETVSIRCSKGISHDTPSILSNPDAANSADLARLNTAANVFNATVLDNGNSFLYNICLHWFSLLFGSSIAVYMLLSKLCAIAALIAFYALCNQFFNNSIFTSIAILFLAADNNFIGMSHEIRAYSMGIFFVTIAAVYFVKFLYEKESPFYLFLTGMFSACAILSHFLSVYIIVVFLCVLLFTKKGKLFSGRNMIAMLLPIAILAAFFYFSYTGLQIMNTQNQQIQAKYVSHSFSIWEAVVRTVKFTAINFKVVFPAFGNRPVVTFISFLAVLALYITGVKATSNMAEKRTLHLLFTSGAAGSLFLLILSMKEQHYTSLYYRYYSFCAPFCCLFMAYLMFVVFKSPKIYSIAKCGLVAATIVPAGVLFLLGVLSARPQPAYNHAAVANEIVQEKITKMEVPDWENALLIQCFLPGGYKLDYIRNPNSPYFTLYAADTTEKIPVIKKDS